jgi:hypothetical protein
VEHTEQKENGPRMRGQGPLGRILQRLRAVCSPTRTPAHTAASVANALDDVRIDNLGWRDASADLHGEVYITYDVTVGVTPTHLFVHAYDHAGNILQRFPDRAHDQVTEILLKDIRDALRLAHHSRLTWAQISRIARESGAAGEMAKSLTAFGIPNVRIVQEEPSNAATRIDVSVAPPVWVEVITDDTFQVTVESSHGMHLTFPTRQATPSIIADIEAAKQFVFPASVRGV